MEKFHEKIIKKPKKINFSMIQEKERLKFFRKSLKFSQEDFGKELETNQSSISDVERGRVGITSSLLRGLILKYRLNPFWLFFGKPPMQISESDLETLSNPSPYDVGNHITTGNEEGALRTFASSNLVIPIHLYQPYYETVLSGKNDMSKSGRASFVKFPEVSGNVRTFQVKGDNMMPVLMHGDYVCCNPLKSVFHTRSNSICMIVTKYHGIIAGRIYANQENQEVRIIFENNSSTEPLTITTAEVLEVWEVAMRLTAVLNDPYQARLRELESRLEDLKG